MASLSRLTKWKLEPVLKAFGQILVHSTSSYTESGAHLRVLRVCGWHASTTIGEASDVRVS